MTVNAKQRLRKSFGLVKSQVDIDLLAYRKDVAALLQRKGAPAEQGKLLGRWDISHHVPPMHQLSRQGSVDGEMPVDFGASWFSLTCVDAQRLTMVQWAV